MTAFTQGIRPDPLAQRTGHRRLNSFNQGSKPTSLYIAGVRHWSTVMDMMLTHGQLSEPMIVLLMSALANHEAKLDNSQEGVDSVAECPARTEQNTTVMKVLQTLDPASNAEVLDMLEILHALEQPERSEQDIFSLVQAEQLARPRPTPVQVVVSVKMIVGELRHMQWYGTLRDIHERAYVSHATFKSHEVQVVHDVQQHGTFLSRLSSGPTVQHFLHNSATRRGTVGE